MHTDRLVASGDLAARVPDLVQRIEAPATDAPHPGAAARAWDGRHAVDLRLSLPWPSRKRFYVTIVAGRERRGEERRAEERRRHPIVRFGNVLVLLAIGSIVGFALFAALHLAAVLVLEQSGALIST